MALRHRVVLILILVTATAALSAQAFRGGVDLVRLPVIVVDRDGAPVGGLVASDFEVRDAGRVQPITFFAEGAPGPSVPLHLALMFDTSESMEKELDLAARLGVGLVDGIPEAVDVTLVEFDETVRVSRFEPPSYHRLIERLRQRELGRSTALFDALGRYAALVADRPGQHVLVVVTDGEDSGSGLNVSDAFDLVRIGNIIVYTVGHLGQTSGNTRARLQALLTGLARETGGDAFFPSVSKDIPGIVSRIRAEVEARYTIGYVRPIAERGEKFRRVEVRLRRPDLSRVRLRTRSGYFP